MLERGDCAAVKVLQRIGDWERVWIRLAAVRQDGEWSQSLLELVSGAPPPSWTEQRWEYEDVVFTASEQKGNDVAAWLLAERLVIPGMEVKLPPLADPIQWERRASESAFSFEVLPWPHVMYRLSGQSVLEGPASGPMIGPVAPSFARFANAAAAFFGVPSGPGQSFDHVAPLFREQDLSGRIVVVRHSTVEVQVEVEGDHLSDTVVELAHDWPGQSRSLDDASSQTVWFPTPGGLPPVPGLS